MKGFAAISVALLTVVTPLTAWSQSREGGNMGIPAEGMDHVTEGEPRRDPGEAVRRDKFDDTVTRLFNTADVDRDGMITLTELRGLIERHKDEAIRGRFASIDANRDQSISFAEFNQWQRALGSVVLSEEGASAASNTVVSEDIALVPDRGSGAMVLARLVAPLNATMLATANTDHDAGASLAEVLAYEGKRFEAADANSDGWVTEEELRQASSPRR